MLPWAYRLGSMGWATYGLACKNSFCEFPSTADDDDDENNNNNNDKTNYNH